MKTLLITISRGSIAKNILHNEFYEILKKFDLRIIILSPAFKDEEFKKMFSGANIVFEPLYEHKWNLLDYFFVGLHKALVYNETTVLRDRFGIVSKKETNFLRRTLKRIIFKKLSRVKLLKNAARFLDYIFCPGKKYNQLFLKYKPELVFSTNPMEDSDSFVLKTAKKFKVKSIALSKSWDNLSKMSFRVRPDTFCVWGEALVEQIIRYQNVGRDRIQIIGVPQFDIYARPDKLSSREKFFEKIGVDPQKKLLVFGSNSKHTPYDAEVVETILNWIRKNELSKECALFIRPYFAAKDEEKKFDRFIGHKDIVIDSWFKKNNLFRDQWDYSYEHMIHFADLIKHSSIVLNYASTLTLDAAAFDRPTIGMAFDGARTLPYGRSMARWYDSTHFKEVVAQNGMRVVYSLAELKPAINLYLNDPDLHAQGRQKLREKFCHKLDGKSGERLAYKLLNILNGQYG